MLIHVNAAPSYRQDKNGLVERHWQMMVSMARNWLASAELPGRSGIMQLTGLMKYVTTFHFNWRMVVLQHPLS